MGEEKVYCENCKFSKMKMKWINEEQWYQTWWCRNPQFATMDNPVNKPFVGKIECIKINKNNDCKGFIKVGFLKRIFG